MKTTHPLLFCRKATTAQSSLGRSLSSFTGNVRKTSSLPTARLQQGAVRINAQNDFSLRLRIDSQMFFRICSKCLPLSLLLSICHPICLPRGVSQVCVWSRHWLCMRTQGVDGTTYICSVCDCTRRRLKYAKGKGELFKRKDGKLTKKGLVGLQGPEFMTKVWFPARCIAPTLATYQVNSGHITVIWQNCSGVGTRCFGGLSKH